jgi:RNA polymerase sigma-70 factor (ECF subfamily)
MFANHRAQPDEELMHLVQQGNERALTELYERYSTKLVRYFHRMLWRDEEKAQDFLHDLFLKVIEQPQKFDTGRRFSTWIYSVAFNMCKNEYRRQGFRNGHVIDHSDKVVFQPDADNGEFQRTLDIGLKEIDEVDRSLFVLRYELDLPLAEIGTILGCPEGTVKSRIFYLKKKLARHLRVFNPAIQ